MTFYKILTHDYRPPLQGGGPIWDGQTLPFELPKVQVDTGPDECARGWNFVSDLGACLRIGGLWPTGRPSCVVRVEPVGEAIVRGDKCRAEQIVIVARASEREIRAAIVRLSESFGDEAPHMVRSQMVWRRALGRRHWDPDRVESLLLRALRKRGLEWTTKRFDSARDAKDAREAWSAMDDWDAWDAIYAWAARDAREATDRWDAWTVRGASDAWDAWAARGGTDAWTATDARDAKAAWDTRCARDAWGAGDPSYAGGAGDAWDAKFALTVEFAALKGWTKDPPDLLTVGLREAYAYGLAIVTPTGSSELGWAMVEQS